MHDYSWVLLKSIFTCTSIMFPAAPTPRFEASFFKMLPQESRNKEINSFHPAVVKALYILGEGGTNAPIINRSVYNGKQKHLHDWFRHILYFFCYYEEKNAKEIKIRRLQSLYFNFIQISFIHLSFNATSSMLSTWEMVNVI